ncbi:MAG: type II secretion system protein [Candidatus Magasanikbacteria bacterium]
MNQTKNKKEKGFSLVELLIYIAIFATSSVFLVSMLMIFTRINLRQNSVNEINQQISFVTNTVQRLVQDSALIDIKKGQSTSTLVLRMSSSSLSKTKVYLDEKDKIIYMEQGTSSPVALTDTNVEVSDFSVTRYQNPGAHDTVQVYLTMRYDTSNPRAKFRRTVRTAFSRVSAATFDSNILPNQNATFDLGNSTQKWEDGFFSGNLGIGVSPSSNAALKTNGDIAVSSSSKGLVLTSPGGSCFRIGVDNSGNITTSSVTCP